MEQNHWTRIKTLFEEAVDRPAAERTAFLDAACAGDSALRAEVEALLASDEAATGFLDTPAVLDAAPAPSAREPELDPGTRIGAYRLVREVGRGGMGTVYLAERADGQFHQQVALKVLRRGLDTDDLLLRFQYERQILASLDHPHIARLYDGGMTEDGRPYFVMEYVDGLPLTDYCDQHRLTTLQRLALFRTVCRAVEYAHRNLVVHRDLKPSNILVTDDGSVKLLDFGIAKLLGEDAGIMASPRTQTGLRLMTPDYAAPEQIRGDAITTATDVYQLGVLLYELLTGRRPYRLAERMRHEVERVILEEEPTRPSTVVRQTEAGRQGTAVTQITPERVSAARATSIDTLQRRLSGDLDTIVLAALKKEPVRRYASVDHLAEDLRRHLAGLPVTARSDTFGYRASKFVQRHRAGVAAAALVLLALFSGATVATWQARVAAVERDRARAEAAKAEQINTFLQEMLNAVDPHQDGRDVTVAEVLDQASQQVETELSGQPEVEAALHRVIGVTYQNLGRYEEAENHLERALALHRAHLGATHPETAQSIKDLALIAHWQGDLSAADEAYQQAVALFRQYGEASVGYAEALNDYGLLLLDYGRYEEAVPHFEAALSINRTVRENPHFDIASNLVNLGLARHWLADVEAADTLYHQALALQTQLGGPEHIEVAMTLNNLAWVYLDRSDTTAADSLFRTSLAIRRKNLGDTHLDVALALHNLATLIYLPQSNYPAADSLLQEALRICRQAVAGPHPYTANTLYSLARLRMAQSRPLDAEPLFREALSIRETLLGAVNPLSAGTRVELAGCLIEQRRYAEAEPLLQQSLTDLEAAEHPRAREALQRLADLYAAWGRPEQASLFQARLDARSE